MPRRSFFVRAVRFVFVLTTTAAVIAGAGYAVQSGASLLAARAADTPPPDPAPLIAVSVRTLTQDTGYSVPRSFVGQVEPRKTVALSFELAGRLDAVLVDEGDTVPEGLTARISEIDAALATIDIRLQKAQLFAPFDGRIARRLLDGGEAVGAGQVLVEVVETGVPQIRVGLPLSIDEGAMDTAQISVNGRSYAATLASFRPDIDPVTRTRTALFDIDADTALALGQTARLELQTEVTEDGTWVPLRSLKEGDKGQWTLLVVDADNIVRRASVLVIHATSDQAYVQGSFPPGTRMIEQGPQRVTLGQTVQIAENL